MLHTLATQHLRSTPHAPHISNSTSKEYATCSTPADVSSHNLMLTRHNQTPHADRENTQLLIFMSLVSPSAKFPRSQKFRTSDLPTPNFGRAPPEVAPTSPSGPPLPASWALGSSPAPPPPPGPSAPTPNDPRARDRHAPLHKGTCTCHIRLQLGFRRRQ